MNSLGRSAPGMANYDGRDHNDRGHDNTRNEYAFAPTTVTEVGPIPGIGSG